MQLLDVVTEASEWRIIFCVLYGRGAVQLLDIARLLKWNIVVSSI